MKLLGKEPTRLELIAIISAVDADGNGEIDEEEFMKMMQDPLLSEDAVQAGCMPCLPSKKSPSATFAEIVLAAEEAGIDPTAARRGSFRASSQARSVRP